MKSFKELEKELFDAGMKFASKKAASLSFDDKFILFEDFLNKFVSYNQECIKIAETRVYDVLTLKSAKDVVDSFRVNYIHLMAFIKQIQMWLKKDSNNKEVIKRFLKVKYEFEGIMSCIDNYLFKFNHREYGILQDKEINEFCLKILVLFYKISDYLEKFPSIKNDIAIMKKRYEYLNKITTQNLEDADVVSK